MKALFSSKFHDKPVLYLVEDPTAVPDETRECEGMTLLYRDNKRIGANFFGIETEEEGLIFAPSEALVSLINDRLKAENEETVSFPSSGYRNATVTAVREHPLDERKSIVGLDLGSSSLITSTRYSLQVGDSVVVLTDGGFRRDGTAFLSSVIRNIPQEAEICSPYDLKIGEESKAPAAGNGLPGSDYFPR